jgi:hypothetical protein
VAKRSITGKKLRRLRKSLRRSLPAYIDLIQWLKLRRYAQTTGQAEDIILAGLVVSESHTLGIAEVDVRSPDGKLQKREVVAPLVPAERRDTLRVLV